jgi:hypothetical protein
MLATSKKCEEYPTCLRSGGLPLLWRHRQRVNLLNAVDGYRRAWNTEGFCQITLVVGQSESFGVDGFDTPIARWWPQPRNGDRLLK